MGNMKNTCKMLVGKHEEKSPFGIPGHMFEASIEMIDKGTQSVGVEWIKLTQEES
jgi:hypothetical protein